MTTASWTNLKTMTTLFDYIRFIRYPLTFYPQRLLVSNSISTLAASYFSWLTSLTLL